MMANSKDKECPCVYVLDDDDDILFLIKESMERFGHATVKPVSTEDELFESLAREECSAVFMDMNLRGAYGTEVAARIQSEFPNVPVAILTGYTGDAVIKAANRAGIQVFDKSKVLRIPEFVEMVDDVIKHQISTHAANREFLYESTRV
jgi:CheY-like chemotaxis protein